MDELLREYPVIITVPILWGDMDAFRHVNNTVYFKHFEHGRMAYFDRIQANQMMESTGIGPILASTSCRFRIPLTYPDQVSIGTKVTSMAEDRFTMAYRVVSHQHQKIAVEGEGVVVAFDYRSNKKAILPGELKRAIEAVERRES
jgi:acyl-CoA thioester hydrolase